MGSTGYNYMGSKYGLPKFQYPVSPGHYYEELLRIKRGRTDFNKIDTGYYNSKNKYLDVWGGISGGHMCGKTYIVDNPEEMPDNFSGYVRFKLVVSNEKYSDHGGFLFPVIKATIIIPFEKSR